MKDRHPPRQPLDALIVTAPGLEAVTRAELQALGIATGNEEAGAIAVTLTARDLYRANLHLRTASRVTVRLADFKALTFADVEKHARKVAWGTVVRAGSRVRFKVTCKKSRLYHSDAVAQRLMDALQLRVPGVVTVGGIEDEDEGGDEQLFIARVFHDRVTLSADSSGPLLHRRGYRQALSKAPLRETLAAGMLLGAGWQGDTPLIDPMCGSGTIAIEGALIARRIAPGLRRRFAFEHWPTFEAAAWKAVRWEAEQDVLPASPVPIAASDRDAGALTAARSNAERAGVAADIVFEQKAVSALDAGPVPGLVALNPPYGVRVGDKGPLRNLFAQLGNVLRAKAPGWTLAMLSADRDLERQVKLPFTERWKGANGGIPVRLITAMVPPVPGRDIRG